MSESLNFPTVMPSLLLDFANAKQLDPRITFTRASTATYYDEDTVSKAEENLLLRSQEFENASWAKSRITVTADSTAAPDGTTTADAIYETADNNTHLCGQNITAGSAPYSLSVYAKNGLGRDWMYLRLIRNNAGAPAASLAYFDITNGTVGSTGTDLTASIVSVGNGWYRCTATVTNSTSTQLWGFGIASADGTDSYAGDITKGVYLWGAQLEQRSAVTAYTATTTQPITNYIPVLMTAAVGVPRFIFNPTTRESLGLLIEEQRANLLTYSDDFSNAAWSKSNSTIISNAGIAPDGTLTADKLIADTTASTHLTTQVITGTNNTTYTFSCYIKAGEYTTAGIGFQGIGVFNTSGPQAIFMNLTTGAISVGAGSPSLTVTNAGNGWWRVSITATGGTSSPSTLNPYIFAINGTTYADRLVAGNGYSGVYIWGAQLEAGAFATSYIPTVASSVTRSADTASMTGVNFSQWYRADEGVLYVETQINGNTPTVANIIAQVTQSGNGDPKAMSLSFSAFGRLRAVIVTGFDTGTSGQTYSINTFYKMAIGYKKLDYAGVFTGAIASTNTSSTLLTDNPAILTIGSAWWGGSKLNGTIKKIAYYPWRLTNAQLQALTS